MKVLKMFEIKRLACTNTKGTRVQIKDIYMNKKQVLQYNYETGDILEQARQHLESLEFEILGYNEGKDCYYIITK